MFFNSFELAISETSKSRLIRPFSPCPPRSRTSTVSTRAPPQFFPPSLSPSPPPSTHTIRTAPSTPNARTPTTPIARSIPRLLLPSSLSHLQLTTKSRRNARWQCRNGNGDVLADLQLLFGREQHRAPTTATRERKCGVGRNGKATTAVEGNRATQCSSAALHPRCAAARSTIYK